MLKLATLNENPMTKHRWLPILTALILLTAAIVAYWPALNGRFVYDDFTLIVENRLITKPNMWAQIWLKPGEELDYWPLSYTLYRLTWQIFGNQSQAWHWLNFTFHLVNSFFLTILMKQLKLPGALLAAAIFLLHPLSVEAVAWISQLKTTFAWTLALLSATCYLQYEKTLRWQWYMSALVLFIASLLAKTMAIFLPPILSFYLFWSYRKLRWSDVYRALPFYLASLTLSSISLWIQTSVAIGDGVYDPGSIWQRSVTVGRNFWFYVRATIFPTQLALIYPHWDLNPKNLQSWLPFLAMIGFYIAIAIICRRRLVTAGLILAAWTFLLAPVLGFVGLAFMKQSPVADHWAYPSLAIFAGFVGYTLTTKSGQAVGWIRSKTTIAILVVGIFASLTWQNSHRFYNSEALWQDTVTKNPTSAYAWYNQGVDLYVRQRHNEALSSFQRAVALKPDYAKAQWALALSLVQTKDFATAEKHYRAAIAADPGFAKAYLGLGVLLYRKKDIEAAIAQLRTAVTINPDFVDAWYNLGTIVMRTGKNLEEAETFLKTALSLDPKHSGALRNLASIKLMQGDQDAAEKYRILSEKQGNLETRP